MQAPPPGRGGTSTSMNVNSLSVSPTSEHSRDELRRGQTVMHARARTPVRLRASREACFLSSSVPSGAVSAESKAKRKDERRLWGETSHVPS